MAPLSRLFALALLFLLNAPAFAEEAAPAPGKTLATSIDEAVAPIAKLFDSIIFYGVKVTDGVTLPIVLVLLGFTAVFLTIYFKFINLRGFGVALRTARGKYTPHDAPGEITHFQALSAALSATVGLGNIGGVAVAVGVGGPGATFWMIVMGLCGMTTKFAECTLGVKYRKIMKNGTVKGGGMYYLSDGLKERGLAANFAHSAPRRVNSKPRPATSGKAWIEPPPATRDSRRVDRCSSEILTRAEFPGWSPCTQDAKLRRVDRCDLSPPRAVV